MATKDSIAAASELSENELSAFERFCEQLYNSPSVEERSSAEAALVQLSTGVQYVPQCMYIISHSELPCAARPWLDGCGL